MRYTAAPRRREELLRRITDTGYVSSAAAASEFGVSEMTIRRDLHALAADGLARRVLGGASAAALPYSERRGLAEREKEAVARAAVPLLAGAAVVALDAGTTVAALARVLPGGLTVVSHSVPVLTACSEREDLEVLGLGGVFHRETRSFTGEHTRAALADLAVDVAVLSATGVGPDGVYSAKAADAEVKRAMRASAAAVVLLVDHRKLDVRAPIRFCRLEDVRTVVVDDGASAEQLAMLRDRCPEVVVARTGSAGDGARAR
ncbi:MAG: hypothetical protein BGO38_12600 [Cellulomonas sp. 73-145]|uniref:DeoR/GlpR family DNA-binding transcription regulator n=1 Tax=unclassified Cellulomonas TaxID=2620175 RepID=UPI0009289225|nr:DeoR/GlpR family DNA-binding transcription regulator [Cellulomonas sp. 73-145]OJV59637.1 MAG: hypothetical protein BGO38_12600 [Cellulomonas sp. 73-145]